MDLEAQLVWQCLERILFQPRANKMMQIAQKVIVARVDDIRQPRLLLADIKSAESQPKVLQRSAIHL